MLNGHHQLSMLSIEPRGQQASAIPRLVTISSAASSPIVYSAAPLRAICRIMTVSAFPAIVTKTLADLIEDVLPQTQCTKCGYPACRPYAEAIADGSAAINQCPPGGMEGVRRIAALTGHPVIPINPANGFERPRPVAFIDEQLCIGCTLCIQACPVDAIVGAAKQMHTILPSLCTGCDLCVAPCPVDCIVMFPVTGELTGWDAWPQAEPTPPARATMRAPRDCSANARKTTPAWPPRRWRRCAK